MSKLKHKSIRSGLLKKGFKQSQKDHTVFIFYYQDLPTGIWTMISHGGGKEVGDSLIHRMSIQLKLTKKQFVELVECKMSRECYITELEKQNICL